MLISVFAFSVHFYEVESANANVAFTGLEFVCEPKFRKEVHFISCSLGTFSGISIILSDICYLLLEIPMVFVFTGFRGTVSSNFILSSGLEQRFILTSFISTSLPHPTN